MKAVLYCILAVSTLLTACQDSNSSVSNSKLDLTNQVDIQSAENLYQFVDSLKKDSIEEYIFYQLKTTHGQIEVNIQNWRSNGKVGIIRGSREHELYIQDCNIDTLLMVNGYPTSIKDIAVMYRSDKRFYYNIDFSTKMLDFVQLVDETLLVEPERLDTLILNF